MGQTQGKQAVIGQAFPAARANVRTRHVIWHAVPYGVLVLACVAAVFPFLYIASLSVKETTAIVTYPPQWIPEQFHWGNFRMLLFDTPFLRWAWNTFFVAGSVTLIKLSIDSLAGYAFAKLEFPGKEAFFILLLSTLMIPFAAMFIPTFLIVRSLGLLNTYWGLILPPLASPIGIFMMRQFIEGLPKDLENAARIDGSSEFYIYWRIVLPLVKPAMVVLAIFTFMMQWNSFMWPLAVAPQNEMRVLTVGLASLKGQWVTNWGLVAAGSVMTMLPITIVFAFFQRFFIAGSLIGALKE